MFTTAETAEQLGISAVTVRSLVRRGQLAAIRRGRDLFISADEILRYQRERRQKRGRPRISNPSASALAKRRSRASKPSALV